ncbi:MAG: hypothetical protein R3E90_10070 [Marinicella sp.]
MPFRVSINLDFFKSEPMPGPPDTSKASFLSPTYHRHQAILITASLRSLTYRTTTSLPALAL